MDIYTLKMMNLIQHIAKGRYTAGELWWTSQELFPAGIIITMGLQVHISPGG
jgi:hypothetical protein